MEDTEKTKEQLIEELAELRQRNADRLEESETERQQMEETLRESEERFRRMVQQTPAGYFCIDGEGRFQDVNDAWLRLHGYDSPAEVIGHHFSETQVEEAQGEANEIVGRLLEGEPVPAGEFPRRRRDGSTGYHTFSAAPVLQGNEIVGLEGFLIDITERRETEAALRESEERYRTLVERNPHGIQEIDSRGTIVYANRSHEDMYGYEQGELVGRSAAEFLVPGPQGDELPGYLEMLVNDQPPPTTYQQTVLRPDGVERDIEVSWDYLRDEEGSVTGFISVLTDIAERKQALEELVRESSMRAAESAIRLRIATMEQPDDLHGVVGEISKQLGDHGTQHHACSIQVLNQDHDDFVVIGAEPGRDHLFWSEGLKWKKLSPRLEGSSWVYQVWQSGESHYQPRSRRGGSIVDAAFSHGTLAVNSAEPAGVLR